MSRSYRHIPKIKNGCGGWGGTWAKRQSHGLCRSQVHHSLRALSAEEDIILPQPKEIIKDDMLKKQGKEWVGPGTDRGRFAQRTGRFDRAMRK